MEKRTIDERLDALTVNVELMAGMLVDLMKTQAEIQQSQKIDGEHIRALVALVENHEHKLTDLEGDTH